MTPDQYKPTEPSELIGPPRVAAVALLRYVRDKLSRDACFKQLLFGPPGNGKSRIAAMIARTLTRHQIDIEKVNGRRLTIEMVREWEQGSNYGSLFGGWKVKLIEEADLVTPAAQELLLTYLDDLPPMTAVIGTSNRDMLTLTERFATRFGPVRIEPPSSEEIAKFLIKQWKLPRAAADFIAVGCCGNVRDALLRANNYLILGDVVERPNPAPSFVVKSKTAVARAAWEASR